ncbi:unnamed protein product, partial [Aphanomyces euteiches]
MSLMARKEISELTPSDLDDIRAKNLLAELLQPQLESNDLQSEEKSARNVFAFTHPRPTSKTV